MTVTNNLSVAELTRKLIDIPSVSGSEAELETFIRSYMPSCYELEFDNDTALFFRRPGPANRSTVILAGHTDTVPIENNVPSRLAGDIIFGRGASDMKGGLAVMLALASRLAASEAPPVDIAFLFFGREELPADANALLPALAACPAMRSADLAILMEPTSNALEAGCQGNLNLTFTFPGKAGHSARPWTGINAAHSAISGLQELATSAPNDVEIDGLLFREVASITGIRSGVARNVIPASAEVDVNVRYSPRRSAEEAEALWRQRSENWGASLQVISNAAPAPVMVNHPLAQRLLDCGARAATAKQAWTNAADFAAQGIPAINFGPGDPALAHTADEHVNIPALKESLTVLLNFVTRPS